MLHCAEQNNFTCFTSGVACLCQHHCTAEITLFVLVSNVGLNQVSALKYANDSAYVAACLGVPLANFQQARDEDCLDNFGVPVCCETLSNIIENFLFFIEKNTWPTIFLFLFSSLRLSALVR
jgi:hypothetical protein